MITYAQALEIVLQQTITINLERTGLLSSLHRVLAEDIYSDVDMPPFDKSAMDGFACRRADLSNILNVIEVVPAGTIPQKRIEENQCTQIMTGAKIPDGADCVVMIEHITQLPNNCIKVNYINPHNNISKKAEDIAIGQRLLDKSTFINPAQIAMLASAGITNPLVYKTPNVAVIATGDELVDPSAKPSLGQIRNSNGFQLEAQCRNTKVNGKYIGIAPDDEKITEEMMLNALEKYDLLILSGGVSMGEFDFVGKIMKKIGVEILFEKIAIKPGKPTVFGRYKNKFIFGLPGNPVSTFVIFELLVKPLLIQMMGLKYKVQDVKTKLGTSFIRDKSDRMAWIPIRFDENNEIIPIEYHGSAHVHAMCFADGLINFDIGCSELKKGEFVNVRLL